MKRTEERQFVSLDWIAARWTVSRKTVRRVLKRSGVRPLYLGDARNSSVRFAVADVLAIEARNQEMPAPCPGGRLPGGGPLASPARLSVSSSQKENTDE